MRNTAADIRFNRNMGILFLCAGFVSGIIFLATDLVVLGWSAFALVGFAIWPLNRMMDLVEKGNA